MSIGTRILEARTRLNLTQEALAKKINVTKSAVANYENGVSVPRLEIMFRLFDALECDANYLYQDDCPSIPSGPSLSFDEKALLDGYRELSKAGKEYILQTLEMAKATFGKNHAVSDLADQA